MTSPLCRHGELQPGRADKALTLGEATLVVKGVPATICDNCGERYFDAGITQALLDSAREAVASGVVVDVRRYVCRLNQQRAGRTAQVEPTERP